MNFIDELRTQYEAAANAADAANMEKYMKDNFLFTGLKTPLRRSIQKEVLFAHKAEVNENARQIARQLYSLPQREYHYSAIEIITRELKGKYVAGDIELIEYLITTHSWWDTVDTIAKYILGNFLRQLPEETPDVIKRFSASANMWLNRSAILFQLDYKKDTNSQLLFSECLKHKDSKQFFIQKAIGWALREYGKSDPDAVRNFVTDAGLKPLSTREALKNL